MTSDQNLIEQLASGVHRRGLSLPAVFALEMYKPLTTLGHAATLVSAPLLMACFGTRFYQALLKLLESREQVEALILRIEALQAAEGVS